MDIVFQPSALLDWCQRIYGPGQRLILSDYAYPVNFGTVAAGARSTQTIQITQNADFVLLGLDQAYDPAGDPAKGTILISDSATGEQFSNTAISLLNLVANTEPDILGQPTANPLNLPYPRWVGGNTVLSLQFNSAAAGSVDAFQLTLRGFLIRKLA